MKADIPAIGHLSGEERMKAILHSVHEAGVSAADSQNIKKWLDLLAEVVGFGQSQGNNDLLSEASLLSARLLFRSGQFHLAIPYYSQWINHIPEESGYKVRAGGFYEAGLCFFYGGDFGQAQNLTLRALRISEEYNLTSLMVDCCSLLGFIHRNQNDLAHAREFFQRCLDLAESIGNIGAKTTAWNELGNVAYLEKQLDESLLCHQKALLFCDPKEKMRISILHDTAIIYNEMGLVEQALGSYRECCELAEKYCDRREISIIKTNYGSLLLEVGQTEKGIALIEQAIAAARDISADFELANGLENLAGQYYQMERYKECADLQLELIAIRREFHDREKAKINAELQAQYDLDASEKEAEFYRNYGIELESANRKLRESIEKLKEAQSEIIQLERRNSALAMAVTANHEINQPLMVLRGHLDLLITSLPEELIDGKTKRHIAQIETAMHRIQAILTRFRENTDIRFDLYSSGTEMVVFNTDDHKKNDQ